MLLRTTENFISQFFFVVRSNIPGPISSKDDSQVLSRNSQISSKKVNFQAKMVKFQATTTIAIQTSTKMRK